MIPKHSLPIVFGLLSLCLTGQGFGQQVCLPAPRLLTVTPMGGQIGTRVEVSLTGENIEDVSALQFSTPGITAKPVTGPDGKPVENKFLVTIANEAAPGVHDARVLSRLGVSSARAFSVSRFPEVTRNKPNNTVETALIMSLNSVCNAVMTNRAVDFYAFQGVKGKRVIVDCAAAGIDSKLTPVVIVADAQGRDLMVNRTGGLLDFTPPADGTYLVKLHSLTFQGGAQQFYRLALQEVAADAPAPRQAGTLNVSSMSWLPQGIMATASQETEPNNKQAQAQKITLPCAMAGSFFPAADVDTYEFTAKKGETWWIEVASERLGLATDPFVLVQRVSKEGDKETLTDVAELYDIPSPMKVSSNGYSYDGPPYDAGSPDVLGKVEIKEDGVYRIQVRDLFGGTRSDAGNIYRLIVRQATPDFSLVAWAVHMTLRNGDRSALSKPIALRAGSTMAFEVVVVRRDGFEGDIELSMEGLPPGVTASGLKIPAGKVQGMMIVSASADAQPAFSMAKILRRAEINGVSVTRPCVLASMKWPVKDATGDIPSPRLLADVPVSVTASEKAPVTIVAAENKVWEAKVGETLKIPLKATWRNEFNGTSIKLKAYGTVFGGMKEIDLPIKAAGAEVVVDLAALKTAPGDYILALHGIGITKYSYNPDAVKSAEESKKTSEAEVATLTVTAKKLAEDATAAPADKKLAAEKQKQAETALAETTKRTKAITDAAVPKDTVDIFVSEPVRITVKAAPAVATTAATPSK